jgi:hypothetical protein
MYISYLHYTPTNRPPQNFYYYGWGDALVDHDVMEKDCTLESLKESDGDFDICFVSPGFVEIGKHLYKKKSKTKYVLVCEEDMHIPIETLKCVADYYDYVFIFSEINWFCLRQMGVKNVRCMLPCYNPDIFFPIQSEKKFPVTFLGQFDYLFDIQGATRKEYCMEMEKVHGKKAFIGKGFYAEEANVIYNDSLIALDLPIMSVIGPRSFSIGATTAMLMLPSAFRSTQWYNVFREGEDYVTFDNMEDLKKTSKEWVEKPEECLTISRNMNEKIKGHTYKKRFEEILNIII